MLTLITTLLVVAAVIAACLLPTYAAHRRNVDAAVPYAVIDHERISACSRAAKLTVVALRRRAAAQALAELESAARGGTEQQKHAGIRYARAMSQLKQAVKALDDN